MVNKYLHQRGKIKQTDGRRRGGGQTLRPPREPGESLGDFGWASEFWAVARDSRVVMTGVERLLYGSVSSAVSPVAVVWRRLSRQTQSDHYRTQTPKLSSPDGYRLGIEPSQYCIKPTQNRVSSCPTPVSYTHLTLPTICSV